MKKSLKNWLLAVGVFLFCLFLVPELKARADYNYTYHYDAYQVDIHLSDDNVLFLSDQKNSVEMDLSAYNNILICQSGNSLYFFLYDAPVSIGRYTGGGSLSSSYLTYFIFGSSNTKYFKCGGYDSSSGLSVSNIMSLSSGYECSNEYRFAVIPHSADFVTALIEELQSEIIHVSSDVYYENQLVFQRPLPSPTPTPSPQQRFLTAVEMTNLEAVMNQVVGLTPLLIGLLTTLFGFSKGLALLFQTLRQA